MTIDMEAKGLDDFDDNYYLDARHGGKRGR